MSEALEWLERARGRLYDFHQVLGRHLLLPAPTFSGWSYSTVLPYRTPRDGLRLFGCKPLPVRTLHDTGGARPIGLELRIASACGAWQRSATISLQDMVPDDAIRFDLRNTSEALMPASLLNRLRSPAYAASRATTP